MELLSRKSLILLVILSLFISSTKQDCVNLSYSHQLSNSAFCDISYYECSDSALAAFTSCRYENLETKESKQLTEAQCYAYCYPEMLKDIKAVQEISEKLNIEEKTQTKSSQMQQLQSSGFLSQLATQQKDVDRIILVMTVGCAVFTIISIWLIIRCFEAKDSSQRTIATKYEDNDDNKDLPDIHVDSASGYSDRDESISRKHNL